MQLLKTYDLFVSQVWRNDATGEVNAFRARCLRQQVQTSLPDRASLRESPQTLSRGEYPQHLFEQYKLYVETFDRMSSRRLLANAFFIGLNLIAIATFSLSFKQQDLIPSLIGLSPLMVVSLLCVVWWKITDTYRRIDFGRVKAIRELEKLLPVVPYEAEWSARRKDKSSRFYASLFGLEYWVPFCFLSFYFAIATTLLLSGK
jgi:hypothetical protein